MFSQLENTVIIITHSITNTKSIFIFLKMSSDMNMNFCLGIYEWGFMWDSLIWIILEIQNCWQLRQRLNLSTRWQYRGIMAHKPLVCTGVPQQSSQRSLCLCVFSSAGTWFCQRRAMWTGSWCFSHFRNTTLRKNSTETLCSSAGTVASSSGT